MLPESLVFEWSTVSSGSVDLSVLDGAKLLLERKSVRGGRLAYPAEAPTLVAGRRYQLQIRGNGHPPLEAWFEVLDADRARRVRQDLAEIEAALSAGTPPTSRAIVNAGYLFEHALFHDARLVLIAALGHDPRNPALHLLFGDVYAATGLFDFAAESYGEARTLGGP